MFLERAARPCSPRGENRVTRLRVAGSALPTPSVTFPVTTSAKRYQVVYHIVAELAPGLHVMDLQAFHGTALLAPPTISLQDAGSE